MNFSTRMLRVMQLAVAVAALMVGTVPFTAAAPSAARKLYVQLEITLPNGATTPATVPDGEGASVRLANQTAYGFVPKIQGADKDPKVLVEIWVIDEVPNRRLGSVEATPGGSAVASETSPSFAIRVVRIKK